MQLYKIDENLTLSGEVYSNSKAWGHEVKLFINGYERAKHRVRYYNRTWERYQFESAFSGLVDKIDKENVISLADRYKIAQYIKSL